MILSPNMHEIALQSDPDVRELRYIFDLHSVTFGSPKHLSGFLRELRGGSNFAVDFWEITRSIHLKEKGYLTHQELFTLIVIAVAGPDLSISNGHMRELLSEFDNLLAARSENLSTGGEPRHGSFPYTNFPHAPERTDRKERSVGSQSSRMPAVMFVQPYKGRNVALAVVLLCLTIVYFDNVIVRSNRFEGARHLGAASANETIAEVLARNSAAPITDSTVDLPFASTRSIPTTSSRPAIAVTGSASRGSGESDSLGKDSISTSSTSAVAETLRSVNFDEPSTAYRTPIRLVRRSASFSVTSQAHVASYAGGKSHRVGLSSGIMSANLLESSPPHYPRLASLTRVQGPVVLQAIVSERGTVESVHVMKGPYLLRGAASNAVRSWRYRPYVSKGEPVKVATIVTVDFSLKY